MKKQYRRYLTLLSCLTVMFGMTTVALGYDHPSVQLLNHNGQPISAADGPATAFSSRRTCNFCHDSALIEQHSYHAQIGSNEMKGFDPFNPNSSDKYKAGVAAKGKSWVQSPGHIGKW